MRVAGLHNRAKSTAASPLAARTAPTYIGAMPSPDQPSRCAICGKPQAKEVRPFCSRRCADVDLHRWFAGAYAVPATEEDDEDGTRDDEGGGGRGGGRDDDEGR
jgi:endogenous inhibitor of DNA gyrase (YacG/DUF329 family)